MTRQLEIIIYGMACFDEQNGTYRVLFPDGRDPSPFNIPAHSAWLWVRPRTEVATVRWPALSFNNDYLVERRSTLTISGLNPTTIDATQFTGRLANLRDSDPGYTLSNYPEAIIATTIDRGTLSAHELTPGGSIVVRWQVEADDAAQIRFSFVSNGVESFVDITPGTTQVFIANIGAASGSIDDDSHCLLYRKLSTDKVTPLAVVEPQQTPVLQGVTLIDPTDKYSLLTPFRDCSGAFAH